MGGLRKAGEKRAGGGFLKRGQKEPKRKKNAFKYFAIEKAREKGLELGKHRGCSRRTELFLKHPYL